jgi:type I restriction enzyme M protein
MRPDARLGFTVDASQIRNTIYTPRYYDPSIEERVEELSTTHDLVSIQQLMAGGELQLRQGKYIDKMNYGTGQVPYIRTSDIANWELRASPKHGINEVIAAQ